MGRWLVSLAALALGACSSQMPLQTAEPGASQPAAQSSGRAAGTHLPTSRKPQVALKKWGGFYKDDGPADDIPENLEDIPDAVPKWEPIHKPATRPYVVLGKEYVPNATLRPYKEKGIASWYGRKFHGQKTSIGEPYDMFAMTAAHTTLAIPSYVRVSNPQNGKSVIVRVTDRGPFHADRIIDLSYTAAWKLGLVAGGSGQVEVEAILPDESGSFAYARSSAPAAPAQEDGLWALAKRIFASEDTARPAALAAAGEAGNDGRPTHGIYLQLGAFTNADNAESLKNHLSRELDWVTEPMRISVSSGIHRLQLGPYASRGDASKVAEKIRLTLGLKPTVVSR